MSPKKSLANLLLASMFLALALVLPFLTGQIPQIGNMLCPMHFPILLCGFLVGPLYGGIIGFIAPLLRFTIFGIPPVIPTGISMAFELATYGLLSGLLYKRMKKTKTSVYTSLIISMLAGRAIWGIVRLMLFGLTGSEFGTSIFFAGAFTTAIPGIVLQIIIIPILVNSVRRYNI